MSQVAPIYYVLNKKLCQFKGWVTSKIVIATHSKDRS
jgi:hypothetical protein